MKKFLSLFLSLLILVAPLGICEGVFAQEGATLMVANKFYSSPLMNSEKLYYNISTSSSTSSYSGKTYYTAGKELYNQIKSNLIKRNEEFTVRLYSTKSLSNSAIKSSLLDSLQAAMSDELSTSALDGDYIQFQWDRINYSTNGPQKANGKYYYDITIYMRYRANAAEEKEVDKVVSSFVSSIDTSTMSDYDIIKTIHDFICSKTRYEKKALLFAGTVSGAFGYAFTAYGALVKGSSVCQGYSLAFYRLAKELGYSCRIAYSDPYEGCHAWNIVELNNQYYAVDTTWDDDNDKYSLDYFLVSCENLKKDDTENREHLIVKDMHTSYFDKTYQANFANEDYDNNDTNLISNCTISLSQKSFVYDGKAKKPMVTVTNTNGETISEESYFANYKANTNAGEGIVTISTENGASHRIFSITPKKANALTIPENTRTATSLTFNYKLTDSKANGFCVYQLKNGKWVYVKGSTKSGNVTISSLSTNTTHQFKVREYKTVNNRKIYGAYSNIVKTNTSPKTPQLSQITTASKSLTVKWAKVPCTKYEIRYSTSSSMKSARTITLSSSTTAKKITGLKKGKKYYVQIRAITTVKATGKTYKSNYSAKKSITVK